jgi:2',3'-cyclic-nucleotide 2'-phosphodiesterase (5'-nucleotidase family)
VAHIVNGVPITSVPDLGGQFGRTDLIVDPASRRVTDVRVFPPQPICMRTDPVTRACVAAPGGAAVVYEGRAVTRSARVEAAMAPELSRVQALRNEPLGVATDTPIGRSAGPESALGNLFADALRDTLPGADVALSYGPGRGGLRTDLPSGPLTFGLVYDVFPFDNRVVRVRVTGSQLTRVLRDQLPQLTDGRRGLLSVSGIHVAVVCEAGRPQVRLRRSSGGDVSPVDRLVVAATSYSAGRAAWSAVDGEPGVEAAEQPLLVRDVVAAWLVRRGGRVSAGTFMDETRPRWSLPPGGLSC